MSGKTELIVALDVGGLDEALRLRDQVGEHVRYLKVGKELFTAAGPAVLDELAGHEIFLDLKFHDIPNTVASAVRAASARRVRLLDVHVSGGRRMLESAVAAAREASTPPLVFGVTVLTHLDDDELREVGVAATSREQVVRLARLARDAGLDGVVASPLEIEAVREATDEALKLLVPGIRPAWASAGHDQRRVATPADASRAGASYIVVGRAITLSDSPRDAARRILDELADA